MSTPTPSIGLVGLPGLAGPLRAAGFDILGGTDDFRADGAANRKALNSGVKFPILAADDKVAAGMSAWLAGRAKQTRVALLRTSPPAKLEPLGVVDVALPATMSQVLEVAGFGRIGGVFEQMTVTEQGTVVPTGSVLLASDVPAPVATTEPSAPEPAAPEPIAPIAPPAPLRVVAEPDQPVEPDPEPVDVAVVEAVDVVTEVAARPVTPAPQVLEMPPVPEVAVEPAVQPAAPVTEDDDFDDWGDGASTFLPLAAPVEIDDDLPPVVEESEPAPQQIAATPVPTPDPTPEPPQFEQPQFPTSWDRPASDPEPRPDSGPTPAEQPAPEPTPAPPAAPRFAAPEVSATAADAEPAPLARPAVPQPSGPAVQWPAQPFSSTPDPASARAPESAPPPVFIPPPAPMPPVAPPALAPMAEPVTQPVYPADYGRPAASPPATSAPAVPVAPPAQPAPRPAWEPPPVPTYLMPDTSVEDFEDAASSLLPTGEQPGESRVMRDGSGLCPLIISYSAKGGTGKAELLSNRVPVPVSAKFPTGWATIGELAVGDTVYSADGAHTEVTDLSPVMEKQVYDVHFSDGQTITVSEDHLWKVSSAYSRERHAPGIRRVRDARLAKFAERAARYRNLAAEIGFGHLASLDEIAKLTGYSGGTVLNNFIPASIAVPTRVEVPAKNAVAWETAPVVDRLRRTTLRRRTLTLAGRQICWGDLAKLDTSPPWATSREIAETLLDGASSAQVVRISGYAQSSGAMRKPGLRTMTVPLYPVDEVLMLIADLVEQQGVVSAGGKSPLPLESVVTTRAMFAEATVLSHGKPSANWAVRVARPIDGASADLPVDPYALGVWLGDGTRRKNEITSGTSPACTDPLTGRTDQEHMLAALAAYSPCVSAYDSNGTKLILRGFAPLLRAAGVLADKHIPAAYRRASAAQRLSLLQGLMDTDGTIDANGQCELCFCDERLATDALELIRSLGIKCTITSGDAVITENDPGSPGAKRHRVTGTRYRMHFTTDLPVFRLPRKARRIPATTRATQRWLYITAIEKAGVERVRCIAVDHPEHLYLTSGFVPTHNTSTAACLAQRAGERGLRVVLIDMNRGQGDQRIYLRLSHANLPSIYDAAINPAIERNPKLAIIPPGEIAKARQQVGGQRASTQQLAFGLVLAPRGTEARPEIVTPTVYRRVIETARRYADLVILDTQIVEAHDTSSLISGVVVPALLDGAWGVAVSDMSRASVNNLNERLAMFATAGVSTAHMLLLLNKVPETSAVNEQMVSKMFGGRATFAGRITQNDQYGALLNIGTLDHDNPAAAPALDAVLHRITQLDQFDPERHAASAKKRRGLLRRSR